MKILYLSIIDVIKNDLYGSLVKELSKKGHQIVIVTPTEEDEKLEVINQNISNLLVRVENLFSANKFKKGIANIMIEKKYMKAIQNSLNDEKFDLILYATPPVTLAKVVQFCKEKYKCKSYLMLKDIFPQNAVDIELFSKKSIPYKLFKRKERDLYKVSDFIGCMSEGNKKYLVKNEKWIDEKKIEIFPNTLKINEIKTKRERNLTEYGIKEKDIVFIFGGNLGKPQGIEFLLNGIKAVEEEEDIKFIIVGKGTEQEKVREEAKNSNNLIFIDRLEKEKYDELVSQCDIGIISLDYRFTIPNYPSRTLAYMENSMPILASTDKVTDIKELVESEADCGKWCYSNNIDEFKKIIKWFKENKINLNKLGTNGRRYLEENFNVEKSVMILEKHFKK